MATLLQLCQPFDHAVMAVIQQLSGAMMDKIMLVFTFLGEETFAILLLPCTGAGISGSANISCSPFTPP